jgi:hypothetical protein
MNEDRLVEFRQWLSRLNAFACLDAFLYTKKDGIHNTVLEGKE